MLRRRPDDTYELFLIGDALRSIAPPPLADARREALRLRIMQSLGSQERKQPALGFLPGERWVLIPAGIGVVAAMLAAARLFDDAESNAPAGGQSLVQASTASSPPSFVATAGRWRSFHNDIAVGIESGSRLEHGTDPETRVLQFFSGRATVAVSGAPTAVVGTGFSAELRDGSVAIFESRTNDTLIKAMVGPLLLTFDDGSQITLLEGAEYVVPFARVLPEDTSTQSEQPRGAESTRPSAPAVTADAPLAEGVQPPGPDSVLNTPKSPPAAVVVGPPVPASPPHAAPQLGEGWPASGYEPNADSEPVGPPVNGNGNGAANSNAGGNGNAPANSNAGGNGNAAANSNAGGNGNAAANSNAGGNGNAPANSNAGGNDNGAANSNAGGNGNGAANSNAGGTGNGASNSNAGDNGNAPANSNAGGNGNAGAKSNAGGNGNAAANSNAGGNGNGNGAADSNAGGNGNGPANSDAGGNGNGSANSNAGGNANAKSKA